VCGDNWFTVGPKWMKRKRCDKRGDVVLYTRGNVANVVLQFTWFPVELALYSRPSDSLLQYAHASPVTPSLLNVHSTLSTHFHSFVPLFSHLWNCLPDTILLHSPCQDFKQAVHYHSMLSPNLNSRISFLYPWISLHVSNCGPLLSQSSMFLNLESKIYFNCFVFILTIKHF